MSVFSGRVGDQFTDHTAVGQHPVAVARDKPASGNAARNPAGRFTIPRCREKDIAGRDCYSATADRLLRDRDGIAREFEGGDIALTAALRSEPYRLAPRYAPQCGSTLDIGGEASAIHLRLRLRPPGGLGGAPRG